MKPVRDIEETIRRKLHVTAGPALHDRVLARIQNADVRPKETAVAPDGEVNGGTDPAVLGELVARHRQSMGARHAIRRTLPLPFMTKAAAAAAVVVIAALLARHSLRREPAPTPPRRATVSAAELLTVRRLNTVHRRAGMQGLERQCEEAAERVDIGHTKMSIEDLIAEFNGS